MSMTDKEREEFERKIGDLGAKHVVSYLDQVEEKLKGDGPVTVRDLVVDAFTAGVGCGLKIREALDKGEI